MIPKHPPKRLNYPTIPSQKKAPTKKTIKNIAFFGCPSCPSAAIFTAIFTVSLRGRCPPTMDAEKGDCPTERRSLLRAEGQTSTSWPVAQHLADPNKSTTEPGGSKMFFLGGLLWKNHMKITRKSMKIMADSNVGEDFFV